MNGRYILNSDGQPMPCDNLLEWALWMENRDNTRVGVEEHDGVKVSTIFLGLDHAFGSGAPILYETMVFGGAHDGFEDRYTTRAEAEAGHAKAVALAFAQQERQES